MTKKKTQDALALIARDVGGDRSFPARVEREKFNAQIARVIYQARTAAKLTQKQLADLVDTTQPVIARLEDADYEGHSLAMLRRIAAALDQRLEVRFVAPRRAKAG
ncbi:MAG: helix-turn-helix domain-containing protein [Planctomycetes bacterium]|nr:helix-turn-helix domain-containing protein [Planctomycetota bacterium]